MLAFQVSKFYIHINKDHKVPGGDLKYFVKNKIKNQLLVTD